MKIELIVPGSTVEKWLKDGIQEYLSRISFYVSYSIREIPPVRNQSSLPPEVVQYEEYKQISKIIKGFDKVVLLDEKGRHFRSVEFAESIQKQLNTGIRSICFVAGGAYGFHPKIQEEGYDLLALSKMTFTHRMVRLIFSEQLYRAFTILRGEKYHHE